MTETQNTVAPAPPAVQDFGTELHEKLWPSMHYGFSTTSKRTCDIASRLYAERTAAKDAECAELRGQVETLCSLVGCDPPALSAAPAKPETSEAVRAFAVALPTIEAAVRAERESCAKGLDNKYNVVSGNTGDWWAGYRKALVEGSEAIRSRTVTSKMASTDGMAGVGQPVAAAGPSEAIAERMVRFKDGIIFVHHPNDDSRYISFQTTVGHVVWNESAANYLRDCIRQALESQQKDAPEFDGTDAAHPAWWRGHEHTAKVFCQMVNEILDGKPNSGGVSIEPWEATKKRLHALALESQRPAMGFDVEAIKNESQKMRDAAHWSSDYQSGFNAALDFFLTCCRRHAAAGANGEGR